jgi:uncharacterized protein with PIN domain
MPVIDDIRFIADENVGGLARILRLLGFNTTFFKDGQDSQLVNLALAENRIILTRDSHISERRLITSHQVRLVFIHSDNKLQQIKQVEEELNLKNQIQPFTLCLECNRALLPIDREEVRNRVPPYVFQTQMKYVECTLCRRIYWKGTHWQSMTKVLLNLNIVTSGVDQ